jgi:membrane-associated protein
MFLILFIETGLVIFPFLPGDSLLFAAGALTAIGEGSLHLPLLLIICYLGAVVGDTVNYWIGHKLGTKALYSKKVSRFIKPEQVKKAEDFFNEKGKYTIFLARFIPFIRTFVPFIAGSSKMHWYTFSFFNILGGICWASIGVLAGYFLGNIPVVHDHFSLIMLAIIAISLVPVCISVLKSKFSKEPVA